MEDKIINPLKCHCTLYLLYMEIWSSYSPGPQREYLGASQCLTLCPQITSKDQKKYPDT